MPAKYTAVLSLFGGKVYAGNPETGLAVAGEDRDEALEGLRQLLEQHLRTGADASHMPEEFLPRLSMRDLEIFDGRR